MPEQIKGVITLDFRPFVRAIENMQRAFKPLAIRIRAKHSITTSYAPVLGASTDI